MLNRQGRPTSAGGTAAGSPPDNRKPSAGPTAPLAGRGPLGSSNPGRYETTGDPISDRTGELSFPSRLGGPRPGERRYRALRGSREPGRIARPFRCACRREITGIDTGLLPAGGLHCHHEGTMPRLNERMAPASPAFGRRANPAGSRSSQRAGRASRPEDDSRAISVTLTGMTQRALFRPRRRAWRIVRHDGRSKGRDRRQGSKARPGARCWCRVIPRPWHQTRPRGR